MEGTAPTGYIFHELYMWHNPGSLGNSRKGIQPVEHYEDPETKRRMHNLLSATGLLDSLKQLKPREATEEELLRVHGEQYVRHIQALSRDSSKGMHRAGHELSLAPGGYEIAALAAGGAIVLTDAAVSGSVRNGYLLCRPPGHHAERDRGMGFCVFNNIAVAAAHAMAAHGLTRIAVVDYDVHHGNGTQQIFWEDDRLLMISLHQDNNYPLNSGAVTEVGAGNGEGFTINVPLPPGSGSGAYRAAFERVVVPALNAFRPQLILVSSGFDASHLDPLASQMLTSEDYRQFTHMLMEVAARCSCGLLYMHEGGYSKYYVPYCGLAVVEELAGVRTDVRDPQLEDAPLWGYQDLQPWQDAVISKCEEVVGLLRSKLAAKETGAPTL